MKVADIDILILCVYHKLLAFSVLVNWTQKGSIQFLVLLFPLIGRLLLMSVYVYIGVHELQ